MSSLFKPDVPSSSSTAQETAAEQRAAADAQKETQSQLTVETNLRNRNRGIRSLLGSAQGLTSLIGSG